MSNLVFPVFPGLAWNVEKTPMFNTAIQPPGDLRKEVRVSLMSQPQYKFKTTFNYLRENRAHSSSAIPDFHLSALEGFYNARSGAFDSFLLDLSALTHDPASSSVTGKTIGVGNGITTAFQLIRSFGGFTEELYEIKTGLNIYRSDWQNPINFLKWSEDYTQSSAWNVGTCTITVNAGVAADGSQTADLVAKGDTFSGVGINQAALNADGVNVFTFSIYVKAGTSSTVSLGILDNGAAWTNLAGAIISGPGTISNPGGSPLLIAGLNALQWTRVRITQTAPLTAGHTQNVYIYPGGFSSTTKGDSNYCWGAQLEYGATTSAYQKTVALAGIGPVLMYSTARTNLLQQSQDWTQTAWTKTNITVTAAAATAPDGSGATAQKAAKSNTTANASVSQAFITTAAPVPQYTITLWLMASTSTLADVGIFDSTAAAFPAQTMTVLSGPGTAGAGGAANLNRISGLSATRWTRVQVTLNAAPAAAHSLAFQCYPDGANSTTTGNAVFIYAAQSESGPLATAYIVTTTATATITDYSLGQFQSGMVTFAAAPAINTILAADVGWYYRVRFLDDTSTTFNNFMYQLWELNQITFVQTST